MSFDVRNHRCYNPSVRLKAKPSVFLLGIELLGGTMPIAQPGKELHALCHEHHVDMGPSQIALMIEGELSVAPAYACPRPDCFVHYATSHGYFLATKYGQIERDSTPRVTCPRDGQPMYLARTNPEVSSFRLWTCPQCDATRTNSDDLEGGIRQ